MPSIKYTVETGKVMWIKGLCNTILVKWIILSDALMGMTECQYYISMHIIIDIHILM